ncbi:MAG: xanthine dehydrogenase family protein subunit M [Armatimonadota bacterium]|nr:xanthine dehydrogenase family protein subunit M [Armatimonadota bacterium]MDR7450320.1 xanthine dehydrogenase family protein subunit M [Armatimonadota bacterium]MDR7467097.1 xanthine dehydrogenase family protein subunit M [Armatimonadota bacterium]MDR7493361.1 xanthine dehydrogenase family protein subunit M [Armatimonadota bacterium]MDR7499369.1 xanthine dehydrogenase family protein subunit M [Armatimonadota bacterium]
MIPAAFDYHRPASLEEALRLLQEAPEAKLLAGGHSLLPMMKLRMVTPRVLIDIGRLAELRGIREEDGRLVIGALTTHWMIESSPLVRVRVPALAEAAGRIGDVQVRNVGTIGGSLVHADPAADYPAVILAVEAEMIAVGPGGRRAIPADGFFTGVMASAVGVDEILTEIRFPRLPDGAGQAYLKFPHPASGFAVVGVAAQVRMRGTRCEEARVAVTGVGPTAYRATAVERLLAGGPLDEQRVASAAEHAADGIEPNEDLFADAEYRAHLARVFTRRAVLVARDRAGAR